ncbi:DHA2 family efflux MFS transporter permease subunit [Microbacterium sp. MEC084]|uniref:MDR family MFS transporter n=1 Tax=unclassified Microbacterium TaxID=2609290 RepID=UPI0006FF36C0|nr:MULTISPECIES: MDR family MFS transporter [unclassified Microbacterium]KQY97605.1 multidrug MFS transporter [Microbacterium sp. Root53]MCD1268426.1 DHA2 family efflux MFS transporter permease subunit [Microbacterium sp. MEC084]
MTDASTRMSHRQVLEAISGLLLAMFASMMANTIVGTSLPIIVPDLGGTQTDYTWVVTASLLTTAISTPIWGKLADLTNRKVLVLVALTLFLAASAVAGFAQSPGMLIAARAFQGVGAGGVAALSQVIMADIISPRERGKYMGLFGVVMGVSTVGGPIIGGVLTDTVGWHWNFFVGIPLGLIAFAVIVKTLTLAPRANRRVRIDYLGIVLLSVASSLLLIWVTNVKDYGWLSTETYVMVGGAIVATALFIWVETRAAEPLVPLSLFRNRTFTLAVLASISIGVAMFGTAVYLGQYFQMARGFDPTGAGLMTIPMAAGMLICSTVVGQLVTRFGAWKRYLVIGAVVMTIGNGLLATLTADTHLALVGLYMFLLGAGMGMTMQNLVLVVQNTARSQEMGVASSGVNFFRTIGGTAGVAVIGSVLASTMTDLLAQRRDELMTAIAGLGARGAEVAEQFRSGTMPVARDLPEPVRVIVEQVAATSIAHAFLVGVPLGVLSILCIVFLPNIPLGRKNNAERMREQAAAGIGEEIVDDALAQAGVPLATGAIPVTDDQSRATQDADAPRGGRRS